MFETSRTKGVGETHRCPVLALALGTLLLGTPLLALHGCDDPSGPSNGVETLPELIAFSAPPDGMPESSAMEVFVMEPDGSEVTQLTTGMHAFAPAWSPDGTMLAFASLAEGDENIYVMNADGSQIRALTSGPGTKTQPSWSPDGTRVLYTLRWADELYEVGIDGTSPTLVRECERGCDWPSWSPDGSMMAFVGWREEEPRTFWPRVHVVTHPEADAVRLPASFLYGNQPAWSPDGAKLVFVGSPDNRTPTLYTVSVDGSEVTRLLESDQGFFSEASFSRDGSRLVARGDAGLYVMNADGSDRHLVKSLPEDLTIWVMPRWRP